MRTLLLCLTVAGSLVMASCSDNQDVETTATTPENTTPPKESVAATPSEDATAPPKTARVGMSIVDRDGNVRLVLTPSSLYMRLSEKTLAEIQNTFSQRGLADKLKEAVIESVEEIVREEVENVVREGVKKMTKFRIAYDLEQVKDVRYEQGRLWIDVLEEKAVSFGDIRVSGDRLVLANFDERDAERFVQTYQQLK